MGEDKTAKQNKWIKQNKWRPTVTFPKEYETIVKEKAEKHAGGSVAAYLKQLIDKDITNKKTTILNSRSTLTAEEEKIISKYRKYDINQKELLETYMNLLGGDKHHDTEDTRLYS